MLKALNTTKSSPSTITTTSLAKPQTAQTITEPNSSSLFLEKEKEMLELKARVSSKRIKSNPAIKTVSFDICDPCVAEYGRITELAHRKLKNLSHIFYSSGRSLFVRLTICTGANSELIHQLYKFRYLILVYLDKNLTKVSYFPQEMKNVLRTFHPKIYICKISYHSSNKR